MASKARPIFSKPKPNAIERLEPLGALIVKFVEGSDVRLRGEKKLIEEGKMPPAEKRARLAAVGLDSRALEQQLAEINALLEASPDIEVERLFKRPENELAKEKSSCERKVKEALGDLNLYYLVSTKLEPKEVLGNLMIALNELGLVEVAYPAPMPFAPVDLMPTTPLFTGMQAYLGPMGVDAHYASRFRGGRGEGVRIIDVEAGWQLDHEDAPPLFLMETALDWFDRNHGTAVLGILAGQSNGHGVEGIAHQARIGVASWVHPGSVANTIDQAASRLGPGDVLLLEVEFPGPTGSAVRWALEGDQRGFVPVEHYSAEFDAIRRAVVRGVVVVQAAGNGSMDLDLGLFEGRFDRSVRDSGAIIVGAGMPVSRTPDPSTNFGRRVDVQGWGSGVFTLGYGGSVFGPPDPALRIGGDGDPRQFYTNDFGGTSAAAAMVAAAAACVQGVILANGQRPLDSMAMRELLVRTGTPQGESPEDPRHIGSLPNLRAAIDAVAPPAPAFAPWPSLGGAIRGAPGIGVHSDGRLDVFAIGTDQQLWHRDEIALDGAWNEWSRVRAYRPGTLVGRPVAISSSDNRIALFVRGTDNSIWHIWQTAPGGGWSGWGHLGADATDDPAVAMNPDGRLQVFVRWSDGGLREVGHVKPNGEWYLRGFQSLDGHILGSPSVASNADGRLEVFARGRDNGVWSRSQFSPGENRWAPWARVGGGLLLGDPVAALDGRGRLVVFGQGLDGALWRIVQTAPNGGWTGHPWLHMGGELLPGTRIAVVRRPDGRLVVVARWRDGSTRRTEQIPSGSSFGAWESLGGHATSDPAVVVRADGRLWVFARGTDHALVHWHEP